MIPAAFEYLRAESREEAIGALVEHGDEAKVVAGGHSLLPLMKLRLATPAVLVDVGRVDDLAYVRDTPDHVAIGATTRHRDIEGSSLLATEVPLLAHAASYVGDPQVRNRGTIGGSVVHGDGASDLPAVLLALGATLVAEGPNGARNLPIDGFFRGFLETALEPDELLTEIRVPKARGAGWSFQKFTLRAQDWAIVGCAVLRRGRSAGIGLVNMGTSPSRAAAAEAALAEGASDSEAADLADRDTDPPDDLRGSREYRRHLSHVLVGRALAEAAANEDG